MPYHKFFNSFHIKVLACLFMLIDHMGLFLFPQIIELRIVGRLAFPLFAFMIANGYHYTKNRRNYLLRLLIFGAAIQIPYSIVLAQTGSDQMFNIFFTLSLGLLSIMGYEYQRERLDSHSGIVWLFLLAALGQLIAVDYGAYGVILIFLAHVFYSSPLRLTLGWGVLNLLYFFLSRADVVDMSAIQIYSIFSIFIVAAYNGKEGRKAKLLFYIFYPLHIAVLYLISTRV